ncbi:MAG: 50S ribosomal protein L23 [Gammaproteobacteria bacterium]|jgi:large subunit ribosomal protein L23
MNQEKLMNLLLAPRVTEKSTLVGEKYRQYVFKVIKTATKPQIKKAVELMFKVEVEAVQVTNVKGKQKTFKQTAGKRSGWKKAYVKLKSGFEIDFMGS